VEAVLWLSEPLVGSLRQRLASADSKFVVVTTPERFFDVLEPNNVAFVDASTIGEVPASVSIPVIAICDEPLPTAIGWLNTYPWLCHVVSTSLIEHPIASEHLRGVMTTLVAKTRPKLLDWVPRRVTGRRVRLAHAATRADRLEKMSEFLTERGVSVRTVQQLKDAAEELLTNAFYDAPVAAGIVGRPISRTEDVLLPDDQACGMVYGSHDDMAVVRVRDPFGSLTRARLVEVLTRCARSDMQVEVDESMGGAGLGLWRIFSAASFVGVAVSANRHTEVVVGIVKRKSGQRPFAFHLMFRDEQRPARAWRVVNSLHDHSVSIASDTL
jgi:hypothetical protein